MRGIHAAGVAALVALAAPAAAHAAGAARAARSAELVLPGQPDLERLQAAAGAGLLRPEHPADGQEVEGRARPDRLPGQAVHDHPAAGGTVFGTPTAEANTSRAPQVPRSTATSSTSRRRSTTSRR